MTPPADSERADDGELRPLEGTIERITFQNDENGYTIARLTPVGRTHPTTIVGNLLGASVGASFRLVGRWQTHAQFGRQFVVVSFEERLPATVEGIRKYLGSGLIHGVGPVTADRIVAHFGLDTLRIIDEEPERVADVPGVGPKRMRQIAAAWQEQRHVKEIMVFLQSHGVSTGLAVRIYKTYGDEAVAIVRKDPYRLARDVWGVGFLTADRIARAMGVPPNGPRRLEAGLLHALSTLADEGHTFAPRAALVETAVGLLAVDDVAIDPAAVSEAIDRLVAEEALIADVDALSEAERATVPDGPPARADATPIYLPPFYYAEVGIASRLRRSLESQESRLPGFQAVDWPAVWAWLDGTTPYPLAERQRDAVRSALTRKVTVLTGGPGTGKTTTVRSVLQLLGMRGGQALLAAPTGRAAKRLAETTGAPARTIHRLLEFKPADGRLFQRHEENPLDTDLLVIDELSMVDVLLMNNLTKALDPATHLLLVGDVDQLPSVGAGNVLRDLIDSGVLPTVALDTIFRQSERSHITLNAHRINRGEMPVVAKESDDFFLFPVEDAEAAAERLVDVVANRIPRRFGLDPVRDIQVLTPMHRGPAGVAALNERLQAVLNAPAPGKPEVRWGGRTFRLGDKVMQVRNNYDKDVFNGDIGRLTAIDAEAQQVTIDIDGSPVAYQNHELDELVHAFACSVHKSQGAEYPCVVMALLPAHWMMLQRNLLYTGVTRARSLCVLVGSQRAIRRAVATDRVAERNTGLARRLRGGRGGADQPGLALG